MASNTRRSKKGCETCRAKKVKCDESRPKCTRCNRLHLICNWPVGNPSLRDRRRGYGPLRTRDESWTPAPILPADRNLRNFSKEQSAEGLVLEGNRPRNSSAVPSFECDDWWEILGIEDEDPQWLISSDDTLDLGSPNLLQSTNDLANSEYQVLAKHGATHPGSQRDDSTLFLNPSLSQYHIPLPNSLTLSTNEHAALRHYQTTFSLYRTTKDPNWSTHKVLLNLGSHHPMIMHLLLAVSINDQCLRKKQETSHDAQKHFQTGAMMLIETMGKDTESDHMSLMAAYFFLYLYMSKRKSVAPQRLRQLSMTVLDFVRKNELDSRCIGSPSPGQAGTISTSASRHRSVIARLIMWTFDEDVKCSFQGAGGHFARYLTANSARTKEVYDASRNALEAHWGADYPNAQILDDDQNSIVLEFLWALMPLWQDINDLTQDLDAITSDIDSRIQQTFAVLEEKYSSVFRLSSEVTKPRARVLVNADYDVVLFHALRIYYFRSTICDLDVETPPDIEASLKILLTIIQRTFASKSTELHDRLQWPLFLAGIETQDPIYREWIFTRLTSNRVAAALRRALDTQSFSGQRLRMPEIRELLYDFSELRLSADNNFLDSIQAF